MISVFCAGPAVAREAPLQGSRRHAPIPSQIQPGAGNPPGDASSLAPPIVPVSGPVVPQSAATTPPVALAATVSPPTQLPQDPIALREFLLTLKAAPQEGTLSLPAAILAQASLFLAAPNQGV